MYGHHDLSGACADLVKGRVVAQGRGRGSQRRWPEPGDGLLALYAALNGSYTVC